MIRDTSDTMSKVPADYPATSTRTTVPAGPSTGSGHLTTGLSDGASVHFDVPLVRRLNYFWIGIIVALVTIGCGTASSDDPTLWRSWRGPAMVALSLAVVCWYMWFASLRRRGWRQPRPIAYAYLAVGFGLIGLLLTFSPNFSGLLFALMGCCMAFLSVRETILPVGLAVVMFLYAAGLWPLDLHRLASGAIWALFSVAMGVGIVYAMGALIGERFRRERLFAELSEAHRRLRLSAAREADLATLRERNRLAREMHDSLGHALVSISIKLEAVQRLYAVDVARATAEMEETKALLRSTMTDLRYSLQGLRPAALEEQSLGAALAEMVREMGERAGVEATYTVDAQADLLDRVVQETLYRVGQEALTNVAKHARAQHVTLSLTVDGGAAVLEVCDDGVGLGAAMHAGAGQYGVRGMRERVEALGGVLTLGPRPDGATGTVLRARVPAAEAT